jgi:hypothetical protein
MIVRPKRVTMPSKIQKYEKLLETLDAWKIRLPELRELLVGQKSLSRDGAMMWVHLAMAFNREAYPTIVDTVRSIEGLRVVVTESETGKMLELVKRAVLYTDVIVVYSGRPSLHAFEPLLEGVRKLSGSTTSSFFGPCCCPGTVSAYRSITST